ncbi:putative phage head-tail adaptor [Paenibacillus larvae subsp. larvae]|uniref:Putative phage head-tail adaptor n=1 Tax=Paenibacillus larvae subsp. larvae TaxID=147375 RepID=A0A2L1TWN7_9BACL|nr:phage head closure protein [Paenibacillus larvae]AVF25093.1 putative phage head-tail adaptor [Paenibacillus larvae subsp. larvae]AVF29857.1 putative phage head-tail adaptor [Paenibacillus larvae subsp. larvae]
MVVVQVNPGKLNKRITIKKHEPTPDGAGGYDDGFSDVVTVWANIRPLRGREYWQSQQTQAEVTHSIMIRYRKDIDRSHVVSYGGRLFDIQHIINVDEANRTLILHCVEKI